MALALVSIVPILRIPLRYVKYIIAKLMGDNSVILASTGCLPIVKCKPVTLLKFAIIPCRLI